MPRQTSVSIKDIARIAGVSISTVSNVLNGKGSYSEKTRSAIIEIARREGYVANRAAQALRSAHTHTIGLVMPDMSNSFHSTIARAAESLLYDAGYNTFVCSTYGNAEREASYLRSLCERKVDGLLFVAGGTPLSHELVDMDVPVVSICRPTDKAFDRCVEVNNDMRQLSYDAVSFLASRGCRRIAFLVVFHGALERFARWLEPTYARALSDAGLALDRNLELIGPHDRPSYVEAEKLVGSCIDGGWEPDGIFALGDRLAMGALNALESRGIKVGRDIQLLGMDNSDYAQIVEPGFSSVERHPEVLAQEGVKALINQLEGKQADERKVYVKHQIIERGTTR